MSAILCRAASSVASIALVILAASSCATPAAAGLYNWKTSKVVQLTEKNFQSLVIDAKETWLVEFYADWCGHCKNLAPHFDRAASNLDGVARLGAVSSDDAPGLMSKYGVKGFPTLKLFTGANARDRRPSDYNGQRTSGAMAAAVKAALKSYVTVVPADGVAGFLEASPKLPHVLLFTPKKVTSPVYKGLSATYSGRVLLGEVRGADADLAAKHGLASKKLPGLVAWPVGSTDVAKGVPHTGAVEASALRAFLDSVASGAPAPGGDDNAGDGAGAGEAAVGGSPAAEPTSIGGTFAQPPAGDVAVATVNSRAAYDASCGARKDGRLCALALLPGGSSDALPAAALSSLASRYQFDNIGFAVVDVTSEGGVALAAALLGANTVVDGSGAFAVVRGKKGKVAVLSGEGEKLDEAAVAAFLDKVVGGDLRYARIAGDLPTWTAAAATTAASDDGAEAAPSPVVREAAAEGEGTCSAPADGEAAVGQCGAPPPNSSA